MLKQIIYSMSLKKQDIVAKGKYIGCKYAILSLGRHPVAYVEDFLGLGYYCNPLLESIVVHGGFTYYGKRMSEYSDNSNYLGWDYGHYGDYSSTDELLPPDLRTGGKKWTTEEILEEVYSVIVQLKKLAKKTKFEINKRPEIKLKEKNKMREILFRGKQADNGEWIEGGIVHQTDWYGENVDRYFIIDGTSTQDYNIGFEYEVDPKTVGQYTGATDKNVKKIFEGDIVSQTYYLNDSVGVVTRNGEVKFKSRAFGIYEKGCHWSIEADQKHREIVGNIHDNPELLEEEE